MSTYEKLVNSLTLDESICVICGGNHERTYCGFLKIKYHVLDCVLPTKARLTLPDFLDILTLADGSHDVSTKILIIKGTSFGPLQGKRDELFNPGMKVPVKVFTDDRETDNGVYIDSTDEDLSNWMMFVSPANDYEEQNMICYQENQDVYFATTKDVQPGQVLKMWYAPYYAKRMHKILLQDVINKEKIDVELTDVLKSSLVEKQQNIKRDSWTCRRCGKMETVVTAFASHILDHYKKRKTCDICSASFSTVTNLKKHMKAVHPSSISLQKTRKKNPKPSDKPGDSRQTTELGGPLLNDLMTDSIDNCSFFAQNENQFNLENLAGQDFVFPNENPYSINENVEQIEGYNFEIPESQDSFDCDICMKKFSKQRYLLEHLTCHAGYFICDKCHKVFTRKENHDTHPCKATKIHQCDRCTKKFSQLKYLKRHIASVHNPIPGSKCPDCDKPSTNGSSHKCASNKKIDPDETFTCQECGRVYKRLRYLRDHLKIHERSERICEVCGEQFKNKMTLWSHLKVHSGMMNYKCLACGKEFRKRSGLMEHIGSMHRKSEGVQCHVCKKGLKHYRSLKEHYLKTHAVSNKSTQCAICSKKLPSEVGLIKHMKIAHAEKNKRDEMEKNYQCPMCMSSFKLRRSATKHMKKKHPDVEDIDTKQIICLSEKKDSNSELKEVNETIKDHVNRLKKISIVQKKISAVEKKISEDGKKTSDVADSSSEIDKIQKETVNVDSSKKLDATTKEIVIDLMDTGDDKDTGDNRDTENNHCESLDLKTNETPLIHGENPLVNESLPDSNTLYNLEFEAILNEPNEESVERYFNFDDIVSHVDMRTFHSLDDKLHEIEGQGETSTLEDDDPYNTETGLNGI